jgi:hypothetical protein
MVTDDGPIRHPRTRHLGILHERNPTNFFARLPGGRHSWGLLGLTTMRGSGRLFFLGVLWAAGCADHTFDMLPGDKPAPMPPATSAGGSDTAGSPSGAGRGGAGKPSSGRGGGGGRGGTGGQGGTGALSGKGGGGTGGTGLVGDGGSADESSCPYAATGCCAPGAFGCYPCHNGSCPTPDVCSQTHGCVECRPSTECTAPDDCVSDCGPGEFCDYKYTCQKDCSQDPKVCGDSGRAVCDKQRKVCVECDYAQVPSTCPYALRCSLADTCVECLTSADCVYDPTRPVCSDSETCKPCKLDTDCGAPNSPPRVCDRSGACVPSSQP